MAFFEAALVDKENVAAMILEGFDEPHGDSYHHIE